MPLFERVGLIEARSQVHRSVRRSRCRLAGGEQERESDTACQIGISFAANECGAGGGSADCICLRSSTGALAVRSDLRIFRMRESGRRPDERPEAISALYP